LLTHTWQAWPILDKLDPRPVQKVSAQYIILWLTCGVRRGQCIGIKQYSRKYAN